MFGLFTHKQTLVKSGFFYGITDYHSHILPGVDDGVHSIEESLVILDYYENLGVKKVILTPHIMEDMPQDISDLRLRFETLKSEYNGTVELSLAAEYMLDYSFFSILDSGDMLTLWDNYLLVEMSYAQPVLNIFEYVELIIAKGYYVVLAHPERYLYLNPDEYKQLRDIGVKFQLNFISLLGAYGSKVKKRAYKLLNSSMYDIMGSDIHKLHYHQKLIDSITLSRHTIKQLQSLNRMGL
ncbi:MAG: CpsB/CapC family capsule biosynthesis tyrosine phosphatase [Rikenellaceae bacterium]